MRKSEKYSVAIFLAVALFAGTLAGSAPAFVVDAQATEDKRDYKGKDRHDDNKRHGEKNQYSKDRDGRDKHSDKSSVKYIKCNNVNINGKDGHSDGKDKWPRNGGGNEWPRDGGNDWPRNGGGNEWPRDGGNDWPRGGDNHNFPGFIKQTDKDVVVICIFNNDKKDKDKEPPTPEGQCEECIEDLPGLSPGQNPQQPTGTGIERQFVEFLVESLSPPTGPELTPEEAIALFCEMLVGGDISEEELSMIIDEALSPATPSSIVQELTDCLTDLIPIV